MDGKTLALLYKTVQDNNILPITTICNVRCAFCSHHQNPPEVQAIAIPHLDFDLILDLLDYLDGSRKIIIGESTSLIMEGEPFTHPAFFETLEAIRHKFPQTPIQVTTNGHLADRRKHHTAAKIGAAGADFFAECLPSPSAPCSDGRPARFDCLCCAAVTQTIWALLSWQYCSYAPFDRLGGVGADSAVFA